MEKFPAENMPRLIWDLQVEMRRSRRPPAQLRELAQRELSQRMDAAHEILEWAKRDRRWSFTLAEIDDAPGRPCTRARESTRACDRRGARTGTRDVRRDARGRRGPRGHLTRALAYDARIPRSFGAPQRSMIVRNPRTGNEPPATRSDEQSSLPPRESFGASFPERQFVRTQDDFFACPKPGVYMIAS